MSCERSCDGNGKLRMYHDAQNSRVFHGISMREYQRDNNLNHQITFHSVAFRILNREGFAHKPNHGCLQHTIDIRGAQSIKRLQVATKTVHLYRGLPSCGTVTRINLRCHLRENWPCASSYPSLIFIL
jgi:hypothetical protein